MPLQIAQQRRQSLLRFQCDPPAALAIGGGSLPEDDLLAAPAARAEMRDVRDLDTVRRTGLLEQLDEPVEAAVAERKTAVRFLCDFDPV